MKKLIFSVFIYLILFPLFATHYMGGEITWECLPNGNYRFIMKLYRECYISNGGSAATFGQTEPMNTTVPGIPTILMTRVSLTDMSPQCNSDSLFQPKIYCPGLPGGHANMGALQLNLYTSDASYPNGVTLTGVPPANGWEFYATTCCRNPCTNIINSSTFGFRLRAKMYAYNGQLADQCFDNSPVFAEIPHSVMCNGFPTTFNYAASDPDFDQLTYEWDSPLFENGLPITAYAQGFSFDSPLPGPVLHPNNVAALLDSTSGEISFTSYTQGAFVTVVKVTSFRCGQKISEIFREVQIVLHNCNNDPPSIDAPFQDPTTMLYTSFVDTVYAGQLVSFSILGTDFDLMPDNITPQTLNIKSTGIQYGSNYSDPNFGCLIPPCATLNPPPPVSSPFGVVTNFSWQTTCDHIVQHDDCQSNETEYTFQFQISDDYCPVPSFISRIVKIVVKNDYLVKAPDIRCVETLDNGSVVLHWIPPDDPDSTFNSYHIYFSQFHSGPYQCIDSIFNINTSNYLHNNASGNQKAGYYYLKSRSGCSGKFFSEPTPLVRNMYLKANVPDTNMISLTWNPVANPMLPSSFDYYNIYRDEGSGFFNLWQTTTNTSASDNVQNTGEYQYRVYQVDSVGCMSASNITNNLFLNMSIYEMNISVYPNPFSEQLTICVRAEEPLIDLEITDLTGKVILRRELNNSECMTISDHNLSQGIYLLCMNSSDNKVYKKIVRID